MAAKKPVRRYRSCLIGWVEAKDVTTLQPNQWLDPCAEPGDTGPNSCFDVFGRLRPGKYQASFTYSTSTIPSFGIPAHAQALQAKVVRVALQSITVFFVVTR